MTTPLAIVLVVEDERSLRRALAIALEAEGYEVLTAADGTGALDALARLLPDLAVIDVRLGAGVDGLEVAAQARRAGVGVVLLTGADSLEDRLAGFDAGADDYVTKPFVTAELLARVAAVLRRTRSRSVRVIGDLEVDFARREVRVLRERVDVSRREFDVLAVLAQDPDAVVSRSDILLSLQNVRSSNENLVDVYVSGLRAKLRAAGLDAIATVRGVGYRLRNNPTEKKTLA